MKDSFLAHSHAPRRPFTRSASRACSWRRCSRPSSAGPWAAAWHVTVHGASRVADFLVNWAGYEAACRRPVALGDQVRGAALQLLPCPRSCGYVLMDMYNNPMV